MTAVASSVVQSSRRRAMLFTSILVCIAQLQLCLSQTYNDQLQRNTFMEETKYKLTALPSFQIRLEIDLSKVVTDGNTQKNLRRQLLLAAGRNNERRLSGNSDEGWMKNDNDTTNNNHDEEADTSEPSENNNNSGGIWLSNTNDDLLDPDETDHKVESSRSWYADEIASSSSSSSKSEQVAAYPLTSLSTVKDALQQTNTNGDEKNLSTYIRNLLIEYTADFVTSFSDDALQSNERTTRGWDVVHAIDLRGTLLDVTFYHEETHFIEDTDNQNQEESFASLTLGLSGTAAILKGTNVGDSFNGDTIGGKGAGGIQNRPIIDTNDLRLMVRAAFALPDGPYEYLTYVLDKSISDRKDFILDKMTYEDSLEHDATIVLGGSREVTVRTDLDYPGDPYQASTLAFVGVGSEESERRESIAAFCEGLFLVCFIGGFYVYASYKLRRNHLKQELMKYGEGAILVRSGEKTLFSPESRAKSKFKYMTRWLKYNRVRNAPSPTSMETLEEDGYFGSESFDSSDYNEGDLEMGLRESYDESNRDKPGLDMGPIDVDDYSFSPSGGFNTMKAIDDDMKENMQPSSRLHENVLKGMLESGVVPIPAKDDENAAYLMSNKGKSKRKKSSPDGGGTVIVQRRYVQPASPFEVLYGAAFLHGEAERVEAQRRLRKKKKKIRASPSGRNRVKKKKKATAKLVEQAMSGQRSKHAVSPMMTIAESIDEVSEEDYDSDEDDQDFISAYAPSNFMRNLSEWALGGKIVGEKEEEEDDDAEEEEEEVIEEEQDDDVEGKSDSEQDSSTIAENEIALENGIRIDAEEDYEQNLINDSSPPSNNKEEEEEKVANTAEETEHANDLLQPFEQP